MINEAPPSERISELTTHVVAYIPVEEWNAHRERVEAMVNLINGVIKGLSTNPLFKSMIPPDVLQQMELGV